MVSSFPFQLSMIIKTFDMTIFFNAYLHVCTKNYALAETNFGRDTMVFNGLYFFYNIDNISKLCYDICKIMLSLTVIGNILSDEISVKAICIGSIIAIICLISGFLLDRLEVKHNVKN